MRSRSAKVALACAVHAVTDAIPYQNTVYSLATSQPPFAFHHKLVTQNHSYTDKPITTVKNKVVHWIDPSPTPRKTSSIRKITSQNPPGRQN